MELFAFTLVGFPCFVALKRFSGNSLTEIETHFSKECSPEIVSKARKVIESTPFFPSPYCLIDYHGQLQTFVQFNVRNLTRLCKYYYFPNNRVEYIRQLLTLRDGGTIALDWAYDTINKSSSVPPPNAPVVIMYHGLVGDSQSEYIIHLAQVLLAQGYRVVVMVARGCGGLPITSGSLFAGCRIKDIHEAVKMVRQSYPLANKTFLIGFSLGAALTMQYLGHYPNAEEPAAHLTAAMVVSPPWLCVNHITTPATTMFSLWSYLLVMPLKIYYLTHVNALMKLNPEVYSKFSLWDLLLCRSVSEFDQLFHTSYSNKHDERAYNSLDEYYADITPIHNTAHITTPTLAICAKDDPICPHTYAPTDEHLLGKGFVLVKTRYGGHLAFPEGWWPMTSAWTDRVAVEWLKQF